MRPKKDLPPALLTPRLPARWITRALLHELERQISRQKLNNDQKIAVANEAYCLMAERNSANSYAHLN